MSSEEQGNVSPGIPLCRAMGGMRGRQSGNEERESGERRGGGRERLRGKARERERQRERQRHRERQTCGGLVSHAASVEKGERIRATATSRDFGSQHARRRESDKENMNDRPKVMNEADVSQTNTTKKNLCQSKEGGDASGNRV